LPGLTRTWVDRPLACVDVGNFGLHHVGRQSYRKTMVECAKAGDVDGVVALYDKAVQVPAIAVVVYGNPVSQVSSAFDQFPYCFLGNRVLTMAPGRTAKLPTISSTLQLGLA
jgi:hypothetical protein